MRVRNLCVFRAASTDLRVYGDNRCRDLQAPSEVVGQNSTRSTDSDDPDVFFATQIRLIQSDAVLRPVAEQFQLMNTGAKPEDLSPAQIQASAAAPVSLSGLSVTRPANTYLSCSSAIVRQIHESPRT